MNGERLVRFDWDKAKAQSNVRKHGVSFEVASTVFDDPRLVTAADLQHSEIEDRWLSIGLGAGGLILAVVYLWFAGPTTTMIRLISARKATRKEIRHYLEAL